MKTTGTTEHRAPSAPREAHHRAELRTKDEMRSAIQSIFIRLIDQFSITKPPPQNRGGFFLAYRNPYILKIQKTETRLFIGLQAIL